METQYLSSNGVPGQFSEGESNEEAEVHAAFIDWTNKTSNLLYELKAFQMNVNRAVESQGKGYLIYSQIEEWLDAIYKDASVKGSEVQDALMEAQKVLSAKIS